MPIVNVSELEEVEDFIESILLYGKEAWTLLSEQEARLDGTYTRMLRMTLGVLWKDYMANVGRGGGLQKISVKARLRRWNLWVKSC